MSILDQLQTGFIIILGVNTLIQDSQIKKLEKRMRRK